MQVTISKEAKSIWSNAFTAGLDLNSQYRTELEIHKALLNFFHVGDYYYYIFNVPEMRFDLISEEMPKLLGYEMNEITVPFFLDKIHPEDQPYFLAYEKQVIKFLRSLDYKRIPNYKMRYDYRVKKKSGEYMRILQQVVAINCGLDGSVIRSFGVHTDITYLKKDGLPVLSFVGLNGEPSYHNIPVDELSVKPVQITLTKREKQVLLLILQGMSSKEIAEKLFVSKQTIDTHRKNLLVKTGARNSSEMIALTVTKGLI